MVAAVATLACAYWLVPLRLVAPRDWVHYGPVVKVRRHALTSTRLRGEPELFDDDDTLIAGMRVFLFLAIPCFSW